MFVRVLWVAALVAPVFQAGAGVVFTSLHSFLSFANGAAPETGLVLGSDGNFYGTTFQGGTNNYGTVFRVTTNGALTSLYSFTGGSDGEYPSGLALGGDGNFYGTTSQGGTNPWGTVFKITTNGVLTNLYSFTGGKDGAHPLARLVQGSDGSFYGATLDGGTNGWGTVFKITINGLLTTLYSFTENDGATPYGGLVQGSDGSFYGTTAFGGTNGWGTVFKITTNGALTSLYSFTGGNNGAYPRGELTQGSDGNLVGTTRNGGTNNMGTVFRITANGALTSLHSFTGGNDGGHPYGGLTQGSDGSFYGTTYDGGTNLGGTVFKITPNGTLTSLYSFTGGNDGTYPLGGLAQDNDGNLFGTTAGGGTNHAGTVFKISTVGTLTSLYSFTYVNDGANPEAELVQGSDGNFYGTTYTGGTNNAGTVFKITTNGVLASLYSFTGGNNGAFPQAWLAQGSDGNFYGTTSGGGTNNYGTVFKISSTGSLTSLYSFTNGSDGANPRGGLVQGSDGNFYGTTAGSASESSPNNANVFKINTSGTLTSLYTFPGGNDSAFPETGLTQGSDGNFYGTTSNGGGTNINGTVFKITPNGVLTRLYTFTGGNDGAYPSGLVQGNDGNFYGTTGGGKYGRGTVFKISASGALTSLYSFIGGIDGAYPGGLVQGSDGNFYGMTASGGTNNQGTVFKISPNGMLTGLYSFIGGNNDANLSGLSQGSDGNFYGTTVGGGSGGAGTVFRLTLVRAAAPVFQTLNLTSGTLSLSWSTEAAGTYQLQYNSDLSSSNWTNLGSPITATAATLQATDSTATNGPQRFYRVVLLP